MDGDQLRNITSCPAAGGDLRITGEGEWWKDSVGKTFEKKQEVDKESQ